VEPVSRRRARRVGTAEPHGVSLSGPLKDSTSTEASIRTGLTQGIGRWWISRQLRWPDVQPNSEDDLLVAKSTAWKPPRLSPSLPL
jgi:hypothetical protein